MNNYNKQSAHLNNSKNAKREAATGQPLLNITMT